MADARYLARTQDGQLYVTPWPQAILPDLSVSSQPSISGTIAPGQTLAAVSGVYLPVGLSRARWTWTLKNSLGVVVQARNGAAYTIPSTAGSGTLTLTETMQATDGRTIDGIATATLTVVTGAPAFTVQPSIGSGGLSSVVVGTVLTANDGTATGSPTPTKTRRWLRDGVAITSATGASYTTVSGDDGKTITLEVTASNGVGTAAVAVTAGIAVYAAVTKPVFTVQPTITRNATTGVFMANYTVTGGTSETRRYYSADTETGTLTGITGATWWEWTPPASYAGKWISYQVVATNEAGTTTSNWAPRVQIPEGEGFTAQPVVTPSKAADWYPSVTVATTDGTYRGAPTAKAYEWVVDGVLSTTLTASSFQLSNQSPGKKVKGRVKLTYASGNIVYSDFSTEVTVSNRPTTGDEGDPDYTVTTAAGLRTALTSATVGQIIEIAAGNYGAADLSDFKKNSARTDLNNKTTYVWIRPQDRANPPRFTGTVNLTSSTGIWWDGIWHDGRGKIDDHGNSLRCTERPNGNPPPTALPAVYYSNVISENYPSPGDYVADTDNKGIQFDGGQSQRIVITNCLFTYQHRCIEWRSTDTNGAPAHRDVQVIGNEFAECGMDVINAFRTFDNLIVKNNLSHKMHVDYNRASENSFNTAKTKSVQTRHPDTLLQLDIIGTNDYTKDVLIENNWAENKQVNPSNNSKITDCHQCFFGATTVVTSGNAFTADRSHNGLIFRNNYIEGYDLNGIGSQALWDAVIERNVFLKAPSSSSDGATVYFGTKGFEHNVTVRNNVAEYGLLPAPRNGAWDATGHVTTSNNLVSQARTARPTGWVTLTKTNSALTSKIFQASPAAPTGTCGRYRAGWNS